MINEIFNGISQKLNETFGDTYPIYSERIDQDFTEKCFFIDLLNPSIQPFVGERYLRSYPFDIRFFPEENENQTAEICNVADQLCDCMRMIKVDGSWVRGKNMKFNIVDNVLHFMVDFNVIVRFVDNVEVMEIISIDQKIG